jgi:3-dehydroquinate synthase
MRFHSSYGHKTDLINVVLKTTAPLTTRVAIGEGAVGNTGAILKQNNAGQRVLLLTQPTLKDTWGAAVAENIKEAGFETTVLELPDGEQCKSHETLLKVWERMQSLQMDRSDTLVAVGGGALSDMAGFAASTYLRGIRSVLVPTTLLAQVDAAIGGKTGINLPSGKNLAGTFHFPEVVIVDPDTLKSLPERDLLSGLGEIIKYAYIERTIAERAEYRPGPRSLYRVLEDMLLAGKAFTVESPELLGVITACIKMKMAVVGKDPYEGELRRCLNLGHTLAHGVEKATKYGVTHGEAVAIGTVFACRLSEKLGKFDGAETAKLMAMLQAAKLPIEVPSDAPKDVILQGIAFDKKRQGEHIKFVLPTIPVGTCDLTAQIPVSDFAELLGK